MLHEEVVAVGADRRPKDRLVDPRRARQRTVIPPGAVRHHRVVLDVAVDLAATIDAGVVPRDLVEGGIDRDADLVDVVGVEVLEHDVPHRTHHGRDAAAAHLRELVRTHPVERALQSRDGFARDQAAPCADLVDAVDTLAACVLHRPDADVGQDDALLSHLKAAHDA